MSMTNPYGLDPNFDYESILGEYEPKKNKPLTEVSNILARPVFQTGKKRYAVRVYRHWGVADLGTYQTAVRADNLPSLRLKLMKNIPWDMQRKNSLTTSVKVYRTYAIDKYNVAGYLGPAYSKRFFTWEPFDGGDSRKVNAKTGELTSHYDSDEDYDFVHSKNKTAKRVIK